MRVEPALTPLLRAWLDPAAELPGDVEPLLQEMLAQAHRAWPHVHLPAEEFLRQAARHLPPGDAAQGLRRLDAPLLYLTRACARGDAAALRLFDDQVLRPAVASLGQTLSGLEAAEVAQRVRDRLLVAAPGEEPKIASYPAQGDLRQWVRVVALRSSLDLRRRSRALQPDAHIEIRVERRALEQPEGREPAITPERAAWRTQAKDLVSEALRAGLMHLPVEDRRLLRRYHVHGASLEDIARDEGVHRATIMRRLGRVRAVVAQATQTHLREQQGLSAPAIAELIASHLELSLEAMLRSADIT